MNGLEHPLRDVATIAEYGETYPWITIDVVADVGQLLLYPQFGDLIPKIAKAAKNAKMLKA